MFINTFLRKQLAVSTINRAKKKLANHNDWLALKFILNLKITV
jgi:hypothetical protein